MKHVVCPVLDGPFGAPALLYRWPGTGPGCPSWVVITWQLHPTAQRGYSVHRQKRFGAWTEREAVARARAILKDMKGGKGEGEGARRRGKGQGIRGEEHGS